jgi:hypothetical protein
VTRVLPLTLRSVVVDPDPTVGRFEIAADSGGITVHGQLSTGSTSWKLRAGATAQRSTVTVHVTAVESAAVRVPDIEHHSYEVAIKVGRPGRYHVRISHAYVMHDGNGLGFPHPVIEGVLTVPQSRDGS